MEKTDKILKARDIMETILVETTKIEEKTNELKSELKYFKKMVLKNLKELKTG